MPACVGCSVVASEHYVRCAPIQAVLSREPGSPAYLLVSYSASQGSYRSPHGGCLQYPWTFFCSLRITGFGVGGSPAAAVSGRGAAPLKAAVGLVGMPEPSRGELSVRCAHVAPDVSK